jgi:hypothetical protein
MIIDKRTSFDCAPSLSSSAVIDFCRDGYMVFAGVVPPTINERCCEFLDAHTHAARDAHAATVGLFQEEWFVDEVLCCPTVVGAIRTLLGHDFGLPVMLSNHRAALDGIGEAQAWHHDGGFITLLALLARFTR